MNPFILGPVLELGKTVIDRLFPDKEKAAEAEREFLKMAMAGDLQTTLAQLEVNAKEAANPSLFISGWRPAVGWTCVSALAYQYLLVPLGTAGYVLYTGSALPAPLPTLDGVLFELLFGMLGLAGLRTIEKFKNVNNK